jgi:exopolysaccharide production protein ExoQ
MPPIGAAILFIGFIVWLLKRDAKTFGKMSPGLLIPLIWICINSSRSVAHWFSSGTTAAAAEAMTEAPTIDRNIYLTLMLIGMVVLARRRIDWDGVRQNCKWLFLLYAYYFLSVAWSDYSLISLKRWIKDFGDIVIILIILTEPNPLQALRTVMVRCAYFLIPLSVLFIKWYPHLGRYTHKWTYETFYSGVTTNKNALGLLAALSGLFILWQFLNDYYASEETGKLRKLRKLWPELVILTMCLWLFSLANSSTSATCFGLGSMMLLASRYSWGQAQLLRVGWGALFVGIALLAFTVSEDVRGVVAGMLGRSANLTDRTYIWQSALSIGTNPLLGSGFSSTWLTAEASAMVEEFHLAHSHNGFLETYMHTGLIGVFLLILVLSSAGRNVTRLFAENYGRGSIFVALFWTGLFMNYTEVTFSRSNTMGLLLWLISAYGTYAFTPTSTPARWNAVGKEGK